MRKSEESKFSRLLFRVRLRDKVIINGCTGRVMRLKLPKHTHDRAEIVVRQPPYTGDGFDGPGQEVLFTQDSVVAQARIVSRAKRREARGLAIWKL